MIGAGRERVDFDGIRAPVAKKRLQRFERQLARHQLLHERRPVDFHFPALAYERIEFIDDRFRVSCGVFFS